MTLRLELNRSSDVPLEVEGITPASVRALSLDEIRQLPIFQGNRRVPLGEFFAASGDAADEQIVWSGDLSGVHWIGAKMTRGSIRVSGTAGRHLGSQMRGGEIDVEGDAGDWVGAELAGGLIRVRGDAGHLVGSAYRGSARGMTGGVILVHGNAGNEIGHSMRRGLLAVGGDAADLIGFNMLAGTILVFGNVGIRHGAGMRRGTIGLMGTSATPPLVSFRHACRRRLDVLRLLARSLSTHAFPGADRLWDTVVDLYNGDMIEGGRGELLVRAEEGGE